MKIEHKQTREDGGGSMTVTASTPEEKKHVIGHFRLHDNDAVAQAQPILDSAPFVHTPEAGCRDNAAWFECTGSLDMEFSTPYFREYEKRTGDTGRGILPDIDLTPAYPWDGLRFTHYMEQFWTEHGHFCFRAIVQSRDWNGKAAADRADGYALDAIQEMVGTRYLEPEYIETGFGGQMKRNPNYLKRHPVKPALSADWLFQALLEHWLKEKATPGQRELFALNIEVMRQARCSSGLFSLRENSGIRKSWETDGLVTWDQFKAA